MYALLFEVETANRTPNQYDFNTPCFFPRHFSGLNNKGKITFFFFYGLRPNILCSKVLKNFYIKIHCSHHGVRTGGSPRDDSLLKEENPSIILYCGLECESWTVKKVEH